MWSCLIFTQHDLCLLNTSCVCVFRSPPEPCVRYGVLPGEWVGGEHRPRQECELDVHPERQHAGEALLHGLGLLPTVSFSPSLCVCTVYTVGVCISTSVSALTPCSDTITRRSTPLLAITQDRSRCWNWRSRRTPPSPRWRGTKVKSHVYH